MTAKVVLAHVYKHPHSFLVIDRSVSENNSESFWMSVDIYTLILVVAANDRLVKTILDAMDILKSV